MTQTTKEFFGTEDQELVDIYEEWSVQYNPDDAKFSVMYNELNRWQVRHRHAPYTGVDEHGNWHDTFMGKTLVDAVNKANACLQRAKTTL